MDEELKKHVQRRKKWRRASQLTLKTAAGYILYRHGGMYVWRPEIHDRYKDFVKRLRTK